jgi:hypothetical protein
LLLAVVDEVRKSVEFPGNRANARYGENAVRSIYLLPTKYKECLSMTARKLLRRVALLATSLILSGGLSAVASAPAGAQSDIFGSGAALQNQLQNDLLIPDSPYATLITYTATTSGDGFNEFGNNSDELLLAQDPVAGPQGILDSYVGTDSAPTLAQLALAASDGGNSASTPQTELTIPVAQTPLDIILNVPLGIDLSPQAEVLLTNHGLSRLFAGTTPARAPYLPNQWGSALILAGLSPITTGKPTGSQWLELGNDPQETGGYTLLLVQARKNGAGTTQNLKDYLFDVDAQSGGSDWVSSKVLDDDNAYGTDEWPASAKLNPSPGNSTDEAEVLAVANSAGSIGYATAGDAAADGFTNNPTTDSTTNTPILYALVQDNGVSPSGALYANPEANTSGKPNVYTGASIQVNGDGSAKVGNWIVPQTSSGKYSVLGSWSGTVASDPNIFNHDGEVGDYPIVAVAYDLAWSDYAALPTGKLTSSDGTTALEYLQWATASNNGQHVIGLYGTTTGKDAYYYAPLPSGGTDLANIQGDAEQSALAVNAVNLP